MSLCDSQIINMDDMAVVGHVQNYLLWRLADNTDDEDENMIEKATCLFLLGCEVPTPNDDNRQL